jgi:hypothetical protein
MKKRSFFAFLENVMLWGLRLLVWLWLWLLWLTHRGGDDDQYERDFPLLGVVALGPERTDCERRTKRVHSSLALRKARESGAHRPGDRAEPAMACIAGACEIWENLPC